MVPPSWIRKILTLRGIPFEELHHAEVYTAQEMAQREHISGHRVAKVVVVMADGQPVELVLPASRRVVLEQLRRVLHAEQVRLASEEEMQKVFTDCEMGAMPPLALWQNVPVVMDETLQVSGDIVFQAGTHRDALKLSFRDWYNLVQPRVASFAQPELTHC